MKHPWQNRSTEDGIEIDESDEHSRKTPASMHESFKPDSNVIADSEEHRTKHGTQILSTEEGMEIDESDEHP
jgi:hypothetical protein